MVQWLGLQALTKYTYFNLCKYTVGKSGGRRAKEVGVREKMRAGGSEDV